MIKLNNVKLSNIKSIGYDEENKNLYVLFSNGGLYKYNPVDENIYELFTLSNSIGKFFAYIIKSNIYYKCKKIDFDKEKFQIEETNDGKI